jgi:hypothetical protein
VRAAVKRRSFRGFGAILPLAEAKQERRKEGKKKKKTEKTEYKKNTPPRHCPGFSPILPIAVGFNRRTGEGKEKKRRKRKHAEPRQQKKADSEYPYILHFTFYIYYMQS